MRIGSLKETSRALLVVALIAVVGYACARVYEITHPNATGVTLNQIDRIEIYVAGSYVGTMYLDGTGAVLVGDQDQVEAVLGEIIDFLHMIYQRGNGGDKTPV